MCVVFVYVYPTVQAGGYRFIAAANRDEFYSRPSLPAAEDPETGVIGGRDNLLGKQGGMWLGVSKKNNLKCGVRFRFAALLNVTGATVEEGARGRGSLVADYLAGNDLLSDYCQKLNEKGTVFNPFNLVTVEFWDDGNSTNFYSNSPRLRVNSYNNGHNACKHGEFYAFGNSSEDAPFVKVTEGKRKFESIVDTHNTTVDRDRLVEELFAFLKSEERHLQDPELQRRATAFHEELSSIFVRIPQVGYGTRTHSIVLVDSDWNMEFIESTMQEPINSADPVWSTKVIKSSL